MLSLQRDGGLSMYNQRKIPGRKQRKRERRSKDRRPKSRRTNDDNQLDEIAKVIVAYLPKPNLEFINKKFKCEVCNQFYCFTFNGTIQFCRECFYNTCCSKLSKGGKECRICVKNAVALRM